MSKSIQELELFFSKNSLTEFLRHVQELTKINTVIKIVFDSTHIMMYTFAPNSDTVCKISFAQTRDILLKDVPEVFKDGLQMMLGDAKRFVKRMAFYRDSEHVKIKVGYRLNAQNINHIVWLKPTDKSLRMTLTCQELHLLNNITKKTIQKKADSQENFKFDVDIETLVKIKKLTQLYPESEAMSLRITNKKLFLEEDARWEQYICDIDYTDVNYNFQKRYFNNTDNKDVTTIKVYDSFLMVSTEEMMLMIGMEINEI